MILPVDVARALAADGVPIHAPDEERIAAIQRAITERRGYLGELTVGDVGFSVELLFPIRQTFEGRTETTALTFLMGEAGELGVGAFRL